MKTAVLVNIPTSEEAYHSFSDFVAIPPPIGLAAIAAVLEQMGYSVTIVDGDAEHLTLSQTLRRVLDCRPDYVGSTTMTATMDFIEHFYFMLKQEKPEATVILGGPHVSALPVQTLEECAAIDVIVVGEGEETLGELMPALENGDDLAKVSGIVFRRNGRIVRTEQRPPICDLSRVPMPAYHLLRFDLYRSYGWNKWVSGRRDPLGVVFTGRGCIGKCNFCAAHCVFGHGIRYFPMKRIQDEIDLLVRKYNIRILYFEDDTFNVNRKVVNQICDFLIARDYNRRLEIMVSARVDTVHLPTLRKMRQAGIRWICYGVESGNQEILNKMHKMITIQQIKNAFELAHHAGLFVAGNYMIGHIGETYETAMDTIRLAYGLKQEYASFAIAIPLPGTELYQHCLEKGINLPSWTEFGSVNTPPISLNDSLDAEQLMELRRIATTRFFRKPSYLLRLFWKFNAMSVILDFSKMYLALRKEIKQKRF